MSEVILISLALSPSGQLYLYSDSKTCETVSTLLAERIRRCFLNGHALGLLRLGLTNFGVSLPPSFAYWQQFSQRFLTELCKVSNVGEKDIARLPHELARLSEQAPFMRGGEFLTTALLEKLWQDLSQTLAVELKTHDCSLADYLRRHNPAWNSVGRVCFHLAENNSNGHDGFAFLATYTTRLSNAATLQHVPLSRALKDYAHDQSQLLALLQPVQKAAEQSAFIRAMVDNGAIDHQDLLASASSAALVTGEATLANADLSALFGISIEEEAPQAMVVRKAKARRVTIATKAAT